MLLSYGRMYKGKGQKEVLQTRPTNKGAFYLVIFQTLFIFAIPAFLVLGVWVYIEITYGTLFTLLGTAFTISWILIAYKIKKLNRQ